jgi:hypothetical protein
MTKFTVVLTTLFLAMTSINADKVRGLRNGPLGDEGPRGTRRLMMGGHKGGHSHKMVSLARLGRRWEEGMEGGHSHKGGHNKGGFNYPKEDFGRDCGRVDESTLVDLSCPDNSANEPDCALRNGELGNWLCRTVFAPFTGESDSWSTCGNSTLTLALDGCGCCDGACPVGCTNGCALNGVTDAGVLVTETKPKGEVVQECLTPEKAVSLIAKPGGRFQCVTASPSASPSTSPSADPSGFPSAAPSTSPSAVPSASPSSSPSAPPSE